MPTVYRILADVDHFQYIAADDYKSLKDYEFDGAIIGERWQPPESYIPHPKKKAGDIWGCFMRSNVFALTPEAASSMVTFLDQSCELLPISLGDRSLFICNVTYVLNCLNQQNSHHKPNIPTWIDKYVFHPNRFGNSLFKIPETCMSEVLCVEGVINPDDEFKRTTEKLGLTGLRFQMIWSDEE